MFSKGNYSLCYPAIVYLPKGESNFLIDARVSEPTQCNISKEDQE